jgi:hypothetical protein
MSKPRPRDIEAIALAAVEMYLDLIYDKIGNPPPDRDDGEFDAAWRAIGESPQWMEWHDALEASLSESLKETP